PDSPAVARCRVGAGGPRGLWQRAVGVRRGVLGVRRGERLRVAEPVHVQSQRAVLRLQPPLRAGQGLPWRKRLSPWPEPGEQSAGPVLLQGRRRDALTGSPAGGPWRSSVRPPRIPWG